MLNARALTTWDVKTLFFTQSTYDYRKLTLAIAHSIGPIYTYADIGSIGL